MSSMSLLVVAIAVLPAFGLATLAWLAIANETEELRSLATFEGMSFEA